MAVPAFARTTTPLLEFTARSEFRFGQPGLSREPPQAGRAGERCYTSSGAFARQVLLAHPDRFRVTAERADLRCVARARWAGYPWKGKRVLFLLPADALGENVAMLLFLHAFVEQAGARAVGVFCAKAATDIYRASSLATVYPLWIGRRELKRWDAIVDLNDLESRREIETWPVDMEAELLEAFGLAPSREFPAEPRPRPLSGRRPRIGVLPLASSPLRTLPVPLTRGLVQALAPRGELTLCLNRNQHQGRLYAQALDGLPAGIRTVDRFDSIGDLLDAVAGFDFAVLADSGPAHMTKLSGTPGVALYTSAPASVLQGRFTNLAPWHSDFAGPHCRAPCGLAKVRRSADGRLGCMGSLGLPVEALPEIAAAADPQAVERLLLQEPVPCVARLAEQAAAVVEFVLQRLETVYGGRAPVKSA